jgi:hypothetical protein
MSQQAVNTLMGQKSNNMMVAGGLNLDGEMNNYQKAAN